MKIKKLFVTLLTTVVLVGSSTTAHASGDSNQNYTYTDSSGDAQLNSDRDDPEFGDERACIWLTEVGSSERVDQLIVGETYQLHVRIVNDGAEDQSLENVQVKIGHCESGRTFRVESDGQISYTAGQKYVVNAIIEYSESGRISAGAKYDLVGHDSQTMANLRRTGKAKLYNAGRLNGAQVNHAQLLLPLGEGILIGYDDQDGNLPYGKEYACELKINFKLVEEAVPEKTMATPEPTPRPSVEECEPTMSSSTEASERGIMDTPMPSDDRTTDFWF